MIYILLLIIIINVITILDDFLNLLTKWNQIQDIAWSTFFKNTVTRSGIHCFVSPDLCWIE